MANSDSEIQFNLPRPDAMAGDPMSDSEEETVPEEYDTDDPHASESQRRKPRNVWTAVHTLESCIRDLVAEVQSMKDTQSRVPMHDVTMGAAKSSAAEVRPTSIPVNSAGQHTPLLRQDASNINGSAQLPPYGSLADGPTFYHRPDPRTTPGGQHSSTASGVVPHLQERVKFLPFTGRENWQVWFARFTTLASRRGWSDEQKLDQLLQHLEAQAAEFVFTQLQPAVVSNYKLLTDEISCRYRVIEPARSFAAKFSRRTQHPGEPIEDYAADLKMLYDKAHPFRDRIIRDEDLVRKFMDGLHDQEARFEIEFNKEPSNIEDAVFHAVSYQQLSRARSGADWRTRKPTRRTTESSWESRRQAGRSSTGSWQPVKGRQDEQKTRGMLDDQGSLLREILKRLESLESVRRGDRPRRKAEVECFKFHQKGHYARDCLGDSITSQQKGAAEPSNNIESLNEAGPTLAAKGRSN